MHFDEGTQTSDTVSFTAVTDSTLTLTLANGTGSYTVSETESLDLELKHTSQNITLTFQVDRSTWPSGTTVTVRLNDGDEKSLPHTFSNEPAGSVFHATVTTKTLALISWDPKIKVIPPIRSR